MWAAAPFFIFLLQSPDSEHRRAIELAAAGSLSEAKAILDIEQKKNPHDKRFPIELAGIGFKTGDYSEARRYIRRALRIDPADAYANDFLATIYLLQGNVEAALKYWNRVGKPRIENVETYPPAAVDPVLWDRSFAFSPASPLLLEELQETKARLEFLDVLSRARFELVPAGDSFNVVVHPLMRAGTGDNGKVSTIAALARGLPYHTIEYDFRNVRSAAINISTLVRWDSTKRRVSARAAVPLQRNPQRRFELIADGRDENWRLPEEQFSIQKVALSAGINSQVNSRWSWASRINISNRKSGKSGNRNGALLTYQAGVNHRILALPENRLTADTGLTLEYGRNFSRITSHTLVQWFPYAATDDYKATVGFRFGKLGGAAPFDEQFNLGLDRDHEFLLRGHPGTRDGRKGAGPVASEVFLWNVDLQKNVLKQGLFTVGVGPFLDVARVSGSEQPFVDTGIQLRLSFVSGLALAFSYGRDLQTGRNAFFYR